MRGETPHGYYYSISNQDSAAFKKTRHDFFNRLLVHDRLGQVCTFIPPVIVDQDQPPVLKELYFSTQFIAGKDFVDWYKDAPFTDFLLVCLEITAQFYFLYRHFGTLIGDRQASNIRISADNQVFQIDLARVFDYQINEIMITHQPDTQPPTFGPLPDTLAPEIALYFNQHVAKRMVDIMMGYRWRHCEPAIVRTLDQLNSLVKIDQLDRICANSITLEKLYEQLRCLAGEFGAVEAIPNLESKAAGYWRK